MAEQLTVNHGELQQQAKAYGSAANEINGAIGKVKTMNGTIAQAWQGAAFKAYLEQFNQLEGNVKKMEELLQSIEKQVISYAKTKAEQDQQDAGSFGLN